jgi:serine/threonine protein kinase
MKTIRFSDQDNETRIRETLVAPLLRRLGYLDEDILEEFPIGIHGGIRVKADYVVSAEHRFHLPRNTIVFEVKRPSISLLLPEVLEQARLYASHRSVRATYIALVNGLSLDVYSTFGPQPSLVRSFLIDDLEESWEELSDLLGADSLSGHFAGVQILEAIGSGGYGQVFKAWNPRLKRFEAIKVLHPSLEQPSSVVRRFQQGARGLAALEHPYICQVYDVNVYQERPYYRMELVDGVSLTQYVNSREFSFGERLELFAKVCQALAHAHKNNVVHCDLKPSNVLVRADGSPKLIDFDLCHMGADSSTTLSQVVATIAYMDPTIWHAPQNRNALADVYSMGLLLWSTITGKDLVPGWTPHSLINALSDMEPEAELAGHVVLGCIQENRAERPQDIETIMKLLGVTDWRVSIQGQLLGAVSSFTANSPARGFEFLFRLWQQTRSLPVATDFDRIAKSLPKRSLSDAEKEFVFRAACEHWSIKYRSLFKDWAVEDLLRSAEIVLKDPNINEAGKGKIAETSPARKALDILGATDDYGSKQDSEKVARFLLDLLRGEKLKNLFFTALDDLVRLKCFKSANSELRIDASRILIKLIRSRLPNAGRGSARQIGKLLEKLERCGIDSKEVIDFLREVADYPALLDKAAITLACFPSPQATDAFIALLERLKGTDEFEKTALKAIGVTGRHKRPAVAKYLSELPSDTIISDELRRAIENLGAS